MGRTRSFGVIETKGAHANDNCTRDSQNVGQTKEALSVILLILMGNIPSKFRWWS